MAEYEVVGSQAVHGTPPGETFEEELDEEQEEFLIEIGAIRKLNGEED